jgi:hypothetical protein
MSESDIAAIREWDAMPDVQQRLLTVLFQAQVETLTQSLEQLKTLIGDVSMEDIPDEDDVDDLPDDIFQSCFTWQG